MLFPCKTLNLQQKLELNSINNSGYIICYKFKPD